MSTTVKSVTLLKPGTATTGTPYEGPWNEARRGMVQAVITGSGAVTATVTVQGSNDGVNWSTIGAALSLTGNDADTKTQAVDYPWAYIRAVSSALTGTGAKVSANLSL
ncbi:hypothetical protein [Polaromonas sp.]|uniref:hypothetical protein n=1 Tax=Polaromonas sp. TaxID=1869339 RepID=UPI003264FF70